MSLQRREDIVWYHIALLSLWYQEVCRNSGLREALSDEIRRLPERKFWKTGFLLPRGENSLIRQTDASHCDVNGWD